MATTDEFEECGVGIRGVAIAIDSFVWFGLLFAAIYPVAAVTGDIQTTATGTNAELEGTPGTVAFLLWLGLSLGYHTVAEWRYGQTLGKGLVKIEVRASDGAAPTLRSSAVRNLARLVDFLPLWYGLGILLVLTSERHRRLGDRVGDTVVVRS
ncbi:RDD family protein [Halorussus salinus]|uniref:RDD family protein n=1 Tax=Halorussus salinus TaxID=1364935 RepID=UPI001092A70A|nr:RDD family protein [Halorussus salinus]